MMEVGTDRPQLDSDKSGVAAQSEPSMKRSGGKTERKEKVKRDTSASGKGKVSPETGKDSKTLKHSPKTADNPNLVFENRLNKLEDMLAKVVGALPSHSSD